MNWGPAWQSADKQEGMKEPILTTIFLCLNSWLVPILYVIHLCWGLYVCFIEILLDLLKSAYFQKG